MKAEDSMKQERALEAIESADPELSNALQRLAEEEEQALQHALRDPAAVPAPPDFLDKVMAQVKAEDSVDQERALEAIESADPELSNALQRLAEEEEQALQHALRDPAAVPAPPDFLDKVMAQVKAEDSVDQERALEAIESADPELSNALQRLAEEEEQALQHALRDPAAVPAPPDFLDKVMAQVKAEDSVDQERALEAIESADPELSNALQRLAEEEEQALQHALRDPAAVPAPPDFLDKVMARVKPRPPWLDRIREWLPNLRGRFPSPDSGNIVFGLGGAAATAVIVVFFLPTLSSRSADNPTLSSRSADNMVDLVSAYQENPEQYEEINLKAAEQIRVRTNIEPAVQGAATGSLLARAATTALRADRPEEAIDLFKRALEQIGAREKQIEYLAGAAKSAFSAGNYRDAERYYLEVAEKQPKGASKVPHLIGAAQAAFSAKRYKRSKGLYLEAVKVPLTQAAKAAWYDCDYQTAITILEEQFRGGKETAEMHFILGSAYHSQGKLDKAIEHYQQIVDSAQKDQSPQFVELAWFNLGVVQAARFKEGQATKEPALKALKKSIAAATDKKNRINTIQAALKPFSDRPKNKCGKAYYATEDLIPLAGLPELKPLLEGPIQAARFGKSEEEKKRISAVADLEKRIETAAQKAGANQEDPGSPEA